MSRPKLLNFVLFQAAWFACVLGAAHGAPWLGPASAAVFLTIHLALADDRAGELKLIAAAALAGPWIDTALAWAGFFVFPGGLLFGMLAPPWIIALWAVLAATINSSLAWLNGRYALAACLVVVAAPLSYKAGERLGALELGGDPVAAAAAICAAWGVAFPGMFWLNARLKAVAPGKRNSAVIAG